MLQCQAIRWRARVLPAAYIPDSLQIPGYRTRVSVNTSDHHAPRVQRLCEPQAWTDQSDEMPGTVHGIRTLRPSVVFGNICMRYRLLL
jgi:hypothetical protein